MQQGWIALLAVALLFAGCGETLSPGLLEEGDWGGDHISMSVAADSAAIDYDCAHGTLDLPADMTESGHFIAMGTHTLEFGPEQQGLPPDTHPARFEGSLEGDQLTLTVTLTDRDEILGPFVLTRGSEGRVYKCL